MQPTCWRVPKLFERAPFFPKDKAPDRPDRLIAIDSYLFLSVPIFEGVITNQPCRSRRQPAGGTERSLPSVVGGQAAGPKTRVSCAPPAKPAKDAATHTGRQAAPHSQATHGVSGGAGYPNNNNNEVLMRF